MRVIAIGVRLFLLDPVHSLMMTRVMRGLCRISPRRAPDHLDTVLCEIMNREDLCGLNTAEQDETRGTSVYVRPQR